MFDNRKKTIAQIEASKFVEEACRIVKTSNHKALFNWHAADLEHVSDLLAEEYLNDDAEFGLQVLRTAMTEFKKLSHSKVDIEVGDFKRIAHAIKIQQLEAHNSSRLLENKSPVSKKAAAENIDIMKKMLRGAFKVVK